MLVCLFRVSLVRHNEHLIKFLRLTDLSLKLQFQHNLMSKKRDREIKKGRIKLYHGQTCVSFIIVSADQASLSF